MNKIDCHSSTPKQDLIDFVNKNIGSIIVLHWEGNIHDGWGDDDFTEYDTSKEWGYDQLLHSIDTHYIHGIKVKE